MSAGTAILPFRLSADLARRIKEAIDKRNAERPDDPVNRSDWVREAIEEKLHNDARKRRRRRLAARKEAERQVAEKALRRAEDATLREEGAYSGA